MLFSRSSPHIAEGGPATQATPGTESPDKEPDEALALARVIHKSGMGGVASVALDVLKPLHWIGAQALWVFQPFIDALGTVSRRKPGADTLSTEGVARLLERGDGVDTLASHLDTLEKECP